MSEAGERQLKSACCDCCSSAAVPAGTVHYTISGPSDGGLSAGGTNSTVYSTASLGRSAHQWSCVAVDFKSGGGGFAVGTEKKLLKVTVFVFLMVV